MKTLACAAMGMDCDFVAKGETEEEVIEQMSKHGQEKHAEAMKGMDMEEMVNTMKAKIVDA